MKRRVLLVDDEEMLTRVLKLSLERTGSYIVRTENSPLAVEMAIAEFQPHIIVLDIIMPDLSGTDLAERIRQNPGTSAIPIIFLSGSDPNSVKNYPFLPKPAPLDKIIRCIEESLGSL